MYVVRLSSVFSRRLLSMMSSVTRKNTFFDEEGPPGQVCKARGTGNVIQKAVGTVLDQGNLLSSVDCLDQKDHRAGINEEAKFGFSRVVVMKIRPVAKFATYHRASSYEWLKRTVKDFDRGPGTFKSAGSDSRNAKSEWMD